jgi:hypothetical protein
MFVRDEVSQAVDLHRRSYNLIKWLSSAMSRGFIKFNRAHEYMDQNEAAKEWIESHLLNLPPNCRPESDDLAQFARFFATYLTTSFDLIEKPGAQLTSGCGCYCSFCAYAVAAPNLKTKKLYRRDKERARKLKLFALKQLALERQTHLDDKQAAMLIDSPETAESVSLIAYGQQLVARTRGITEGPAVLALWREVAWNNKGAPKKNFQLEVEDILRAEESIANKIG